MEWTVILNASFVAFLLLLVYPLFVIAITKLIRRSQRRYFIKRRPSLVFAQFACIAMSNILQPILISNDVFTKNGTFLSPNIVSTLSSIDICLVLWVGFLFSLRVYIINYDYQIQKEAINHEWKQSLVAYADRNINFFSTHKATYGSVQWIMHRFGTAFCILCSIFFILSPMAKYLVFGVIFLLEVMGIIAIWVKFPSFNDTLFIRKELKECIQYCLCILIIGALLIISAQIYLSFNNHKQNGLALFMPWMQMLLLNGFTYISVIQVIKRNDKHEQIQSNLQMQHQPMPSPLTLSTSSFTPSSPSTVTKYAMLQILSAKAGFESFINFLVQEWSSEHLIFVTEFMQIKQSLHLSDRFESIDCNLHIDIPFTSSKYASPLDEWSEHDLHPPNDDDADTDCAHFMKVIDKFYKKYIAECAPYEINISWNARLSLCALLDERYIAQPSLLTKKRSRTFSRTRSKSITLPNFLRRDSAHHAQSSKDENVAVASAEDNILNKNRKILKDRNDLQACIAIILPLLERCCFEVIPLLKTSFNRYKLTDDYTSVCERIYNESKKKRSSLSKLGKDSLGRNSSFSFSALRKAVESASFSKLSMPKILGLSSQSSGECLEVHFRNNSSINHEHPLNQEQESTSDRFEIQSS